LRLRRGRRDLDEGGVLRCDPHLALLAAFNEEGALDLASLRELQEPSPSLILRVGRAAVVDRQPTRALGVKPGSRIAARFVSIALR
jgi:hypothetical protein